MIVLPRAAVVEAWFDLAAAWLRLTGIRAAQAHGLLAPRAAGRLAASLGRGAIDLLFASVEWTSRHSPTVGAAMVVLDALSGDDLNGMALRYGKAMCLAAGPISVAAAKTAQEALGLDRVIVDTRTRDHLRTIDRRDRAEAVVLDGGGPRREKTLILAATPEESVAVARRFRDEGSQAGADLAYYHAGLPASLRRVLEDLFAAGRLVALITGGYLVDPAVPPDVTRLVALGLCPDRLLFADALAAAGGNGRTAVIELRYGAAAIGAAQAMLDERCPTRETLVRYFRALKTAAGGSAWTWPEGPPPELPDAGISAATTSAALEVLIEAGIVSRDPTGGSDVRYALYEGARIDLGTSLRYREGLRERAAWADLRTWAMGPAARVLADLAGA